MVVSVVAVVAAERVELAAVVVATMAMVLVSPPTPHRLSATAPTHLVLKLTKFPNIEKT